MKIAIIGASGLVGSELVKNLTRETSYELVLLNRKKIDSLDNEITQIIQPEITESFIENSGITADIYFCSLGTTIKKAGSKEQFSFVDYNLVVSFAKLASKNNGALFIVSAKGANENSPIFYNQVKGRMENEVLNLKIKSLYLLRPGLLIGNRDENRFFEKLAVGTYNILGSFLSKKSLTPFATEVSDLVSYVTHETQHLNEGINIVEEFNRSQK